MCLVRTHDGKLLTRASAAYQQDGLHPKTIRRYLMGRTHLLVLNDDQVVVRDLLTSREVGRLEFRKVGSGQLRGRLMKDGSGLVVVDDE